MPLSFKSPLLLALVAIFFAIGHGHQLFERFAVHHHGTAAHQCCNNGACGGEGTNAPCNGDDHCAWHHVVPAVIEVTQEPVVVRLKMLSNVESVAVLPPDAPVFGIEVPPQITLG